ncbi:DUF2971 domain-containing protein [Pseudomonas carnis]|uniref:DUF2971 domain-containing protein n=1 Tax=Pseudomonas TaxID=286 RepID=UPI001C6FB566|nr:MULTISPECIES: DUF2971 domain-containing protein [Pseudomonas]MBW9238538.1 DUF2971 domain-containing protein [Pseudomonas carnis]
MRLFKYFGPDRAAILQSRLIRFSQPSSFNDPFEFLPFIERIDAPENISQRFIDEANKDFSVQYDALDDDIKLTISKAQFNEYMKDALLSKISDGSALIQAQAGYAQEKIIEEMNKALGVLCLSEKHDDLLMWAHYADCHRGFVLEFDSESPFFNQRRSVNDDLRHLKPVIYSELRPAINLSNTSVEELGLTKSTHWSYEKEWRIIKALIDADTITSTAQGDVFLFEFPSDALRAIYIGAKMQGDSELSLMKNIEADKSLAHLAIFKARVHGSHYELVFDEVR